VAAHLCVHRIVSCNHVSCNHVSCNKVWVDYLLGTSFPERMLILLTEENRGGAFSAAVSLFRWTVAAF